VALALRAAAGGGLPGFEDQSLAALAKIEQVLPNRLRQQIGDLDSSIVRLGGSPLSPPPLDPDVLVTIAQGCRRPERMRFRYVASNGQSTERHVEPYQLVHATRRWYLVARDRDREAWRTFRVDRIRDPVLTGMRFDHRDPPDAAGLVAEGLAVSVYRWQARILLRVKTSVAAEMVSPTVGVLEPTRRGTILRIGGDDLDWIARFLAGLPCRFEILEPAELKDALRSLVEHLTRQVEPG
jgi:predicted DNA-binding transcriptional regulator YafY